MKKLTALLLTALMLLSLTVPALAESTEEARNVIRISFTFKDGEETDLDQLNAILATMQLTDLDIEDYDGYRCTTTSYGPDGETVTDISYRYGLNEGILICTLPDFFSSEETHIYQIGTDIFSADVEIDSDAFYQQWSAENPDKAITILSHISYVDGQNAFMYIYFLR